MICKPKIDSIIQKANVQRRILSRRYTLKLFAFIVESSVSQQPHRIMTAAKLQLLAQIGLLE
uniref:Uncharacterized protein n=1 Tax=Arion vulgaris TaxID=1028688 RepID=A0A0B7B1Y0_9EUPU